MFSRPLRNCGRLAPVAYSASAKKVRACLLNQAIQRGLLGAVALVVDRRAIRCPEGLPTDGLHALLPSL